MIDLAGKFDVDAAVIDRRLPPGTGDTQLTLAQSLTLSGTVIVTTPRDVSLKIARRGLRPPLQYRLPPKTRGIARSSGSPYDRRAWRAMRRAFQVLHPPDIRFPPLRRIVDDEHAELHEPEVVPAHRAMLLDAVAEAISGLRFLADARPATYRTRDRAHRKFAVV